ncbi:thylakoid soluble phosphoprotein [Tasmannia lanceolata]|uniref:thylakoid soluble phosphoprotein n=1 Tax=Tasmannia lanceolata TaxID=3420 RepID=UPI0040647F77
MASLSIAFGPAATGRVFAATATKGGSEEKGPLDWILGGMQKEDQLLETDPILNKVEDKNGGTKKNSVAVPPPKKKFGGFGGLFAKK